MMLIYFTCNEISNRQNSIKLICRCDTSANRFNSISIEGLCHTAGSSINFVFFSMESVNSDWHL